MPTVFTDISSKIREVGSLGTVMLNAVGDALAQGIWEEFETLVIETPQYTGTTAASWNLSIGGDESVRTQPPRTRETALEKGHMDAVREALVHSATALDNLSVMAVGSKKGKYTQPYAAIVVENNAPGSEIAEEGPVRPINEPAHALERFNQRLASKHFQLVSGNKTV